ncbi:hypothetical protein VSO94_02975, partial [Escherichia coli]|nr:hypothetical protein [Escherichia coli]
NRCHRQNMKTSIINGSEVSRLSVAIQSQLTKAEILDGNLHHARVIHRVNWAAEILKYLP